MGWRGEGRGQLTQRMEDEQALVETWMGDGEVGGGENGAAKEQDVDVDGAGGVGVAIFFGYPTEFTFDSLGLGQEFFWGELSFEAENGI